MRYTDLDSYHYRNTTATRTCSWTTNTTDYLVGIDIRFQHSHRRPLPDLIVKYICCRCFALFINCIRSLQLLARSINSDAVSIKFAQCYHTKCHTHLLATCKLSNRHLTFVNPHFRVSSRGSDSRRRNGVCHSTTTKFDFCLQCDASDGNDFGLLNYSSSIRKSELSQCCAFVCYRQQHPSWPSSGC